VGQVALPVELFAARPLAFDKLLAHRLAGEVERTLADRGVAVGVDRPEGVAGEALDELAAAVLEAPPDEAELVVLGAEVRVIRVDHGVQVVGEVDLELFNQRLLLFPIFLGHDGVGRLGHVAQDSGIANRPEFIQAGRRRTVGELAAVDDLVDGLGEVDALPLPGAARAGALEHLADAVRIVGALEAGLTLRADPAVDGPGLQRRRLVIQIGPEGGRAKGVAVDLGDDAVDDLYLDRAAGVALQTGGVEDVVGIGQRVHIRGGLRGSLPALRSFGQAGGHRRELGGQRRRAAQQRRSLDEGAAGERQARFAAAGVFIAIRNLIEHFVGHGEFLPTCLHCCESAWPG